MLALYGTTLLASGTTLGVAGFLPFLQNLTGRAGPSRLGPVKQAQILNLGQE